jgi:hypothetical protein
LKASRKWEESMVLKGQRVAIIGGTSGIGLVGPPVKRSLTVEPVTPHHGQAARGPRPHR